ncbi:hypothetical protein GS507_26170, partial [Rhodococcus hoagii]|nr:hypothetical protein [Prescottella equi]
SPARRSPRCWWRRCWDRSGRCPRTSARHSDGDPAALLRRSGSATLAAEDLICHRNTVIYRTKRLVELTGCSLQDPRGRLMLELAVLAADRAGGRSGGRGRSVP